MVEVIIANWLEHYGWGGGQPIIHVHYIERDVFGNGIAIKVYGEMKIACKEVVFARELKLNTLQVLLLTPEVGAENETYIAQKYIYHKGELDNYASIDVFDDTGAEIGGINRTQGPEADGSIWLDFIAVGE